MSADENASKKPRLSYITLISRAIQSTPDGRMLLSEIYDWIENHYPAYLGIGRGWRNSVRHNLSLNECFVKVGVAHGGRCHYWTIHPANRDLFKRGDFRRRFARRLASHAAHDATLIQDMTSSTVSACASLGSAPMTGRKATVAELVEEFGVDAILTKEEQLEMVDDIARGVDNNLSMEVRSIDNNLAEFDTNNSEVSNKKHNNL